MYSSIAPAMAELIANAYDADAKHVKIQVINKAPKKIVVEDDGVGMLFQEINSEFLTIGKNKRGNRDNLKTSMGRKITGRKGLGKLALFGLAEEVTVETTCEGSKDLTQFTLDWNEMTKENREEDYFPEYEKLSVDEEHHYTRVILGKIKRATPLDITDLAEKISWLLDFEDKQFSIVIADDDDNIVEAGHKLRYKTIRKLGIQKTWKIPANISIDIKEEYKKEIKGEIYASKIPMPPRYRGITLYANGRMINARGFFEKEGSGHFFSYISGWLELDFIDDQEEDLISTNRQSLNWDGKLIKELKLQEHLHDFLKRLEKIWRELRRRSIEKQTGELEDMRKEWVRNVPKEVKQDLDKLIRSLISMNSAEPKVIKRIMHHLRDKIIPSFAEFSLWFQLDDRITSDEDIKDYYQCGKFFAASWEAYKIYIQEVRNITGDEKSLDMPLLRENLAYKIFKPNKQNTSCTSILIDHLTRGKYKGGGKFSSHKNNPKIQIVSEKDPKAEDIQSSVFKYSDALHHFRNILDHKPTSEVRQKYYTQEECLFTLKVISYLLAQLDKRVKPKIKK